MPKLGQPSGWERGEPTFQEQVDIERSKTMAGQYTPRPAAAAARPAATAPAPASSVKKMDLSSVVRGRVETPWRIFMYGVGGIGKSTFFSEAPSPFFVDTHGGTSEIDTTRVRVTSYEKVHEALDMLSSEKHDFKTVVLDSLDDLERWLWADICAKGDTKGQVKSIEEWGGGFHKGYTYALERFMSDQTGSFGVLRKLADLHAKGMNIAVIAHESVVTFKNPISADYGRIYPNVNKKISEKLFSWCDAVLYVHHETFTREENKKVKAMGSGVRLMETVETPAYYAKNRYKLPPTMQLDWHEFAASMGGVVTEDSLMVEINDLLERVPPSAKEKATVRIRSARGDVDTLTRVLGKLRLTADQEESKS